MINDNEIVLKAIHKLVIEGRFQAQGGDCKQILMLLDKTEYLVALMIETENKTQFFEQYLKATCEELDLMRISREYLLLNED